MRYFYEYIDSLGEEKSSEESYDECDVAAEEHSFVFDTKGDIRSQFFEYFSTFDEDSIVGDVLIGCYASASDEDCMGDYDDVELFLVCDCDLEAGWSYSSIAEFCEYLSALDFEYDEEEE